MSEYLDEEEQIARIKSWWDENGTTLIVSVVVAVAAIVGWRWYGGYTEEQMFSAADAYAAYQAAGAAEQDAQAQAIGDSFPGSAYHAFVLFDRAKAALAEGDLAAAEAELATVVDVARDPLMVDLAKVRLAKVQQGLGRSAAALATLESLSNEGYRAWGLEAKGDIHVARGELELAHAAYQAAMEGLAEGDQRPILDMKLKNVAPFEGQYVEFAGTLETALQQAQDTLDSAAETADPSDAAVEGGSSAPAVSEETTDVGREQTDE